MEAFRARLVEIVGEQKQNKIFISSDGAYTTSMVKKEIDACMNQGRNFITPDFSEKNIESSLVNIWNAVRLIPFLVRKTSRKGLISSYTLKHVIEDVLIRQYLSNGECILAMLYSGYKMQMVGTQNPQFSASFVKSDYMETRLQTRPETLFRF